MSGGYIEQQKAGDHQVVIFTFVGPISKQARSDWNQAIQELKKKFGPNLVGVTIKGNPTPRDLK